MPGEINEFDDLGSQRRKKIDPNTGRRKYAPRLKPATYLPESRPEIRKEIPLPEVVTSHLELVERTFKNRSETGRTMIDDIEELARYQGPLKDFREFLLDEYDPKIEPILKNSIRIQQTIIELARGIPNVDGANAAFAEKLKTVLLTNLGAEYEFSKDLVAGALSSVTLLNILGAIDHNARPDLSIEFNADHDLHNATDLEITYRGKIYLIQIKRTEQLDPKKSVLYDGQIDESDSRLSWVGKMRALKSRLAEEKGIDPSNIHCVYIEIPSMESDVVESFTGFFNPEFLEATRKFYRPLLEPIGLTVPKERK